MKYFLKTVIGLALLVAGIVAISYAVNQLLQVGTCASGGPYVPARQCPPGTERIGLVIPVAVIAMLAGAGLYATAGPPPGSDRGGQAVAAVALLWSGLFLGIAFACFWGVWGPDANPGPGGKTGGLIIGFIFVPLALLGLPLMIGSAKTAMAAKQASGIGIGDAVKLARGARKADMSDLVAQMQAQAEARTGSTFGTTEPSASPGESVLTAGGDVVSKIERLQRLRESGAIDDAEFERLKTQVMG